MDTNFQLLAVSERLVVYLNRVLPNFPKKEYVLKQGIETHLYDLMECVFAFNIQTSERIKQKYLKDYLVKLSMLDLYIRQSYLKKYISKHQMECMGRIMIEMRKITYGLIRAGEKNVVSRND